MAGTAEIQDARPCIVEGLLWLQLRPAIARGHNRVPDRQLERGFGGDAAPAVGDMLLQSVRARPPGRPDDRLSVAERKSSAPYIGTRVARVIVQPDLAQIEFRASLKIEMQRISHGLYRAPCARQDALESPCKCAGVNRSC